MKLSEESSAGLLGPTAASPQVMARGSSMQAALVLLSQLILPLGAQLHDLAVLPLESHGFACR